MLVLGRLEDESIIIGEGPTAIKVTVVSINGSKVRLGIEAPREIPVNREEVHDAIQANQPQL